MYPVQWIQNVSPEVVPAGPPAPKSRSIVASLRVWSTGLAVLGYAVSYTVAARPAPAEGVVSVPATASVPDTFRV